MKLYCVDFTPESDLLSYMLVLDEHSDLPLQVTNWADHALGAEVAASDIDSLYEFQKPQDAQGRYYRVSIELIAPENCAHLDNVLERMDGSSKCCDCGLEAPAPAE